MRLKRREEARFKVRTVARKLFGIQLQSSRHPVHEPFVSINLVLQRLCKRPLFPVYEASFPLRGAVEAFFLFPQKVDADSVFLP